jgi:hypothetical protein
MNFKRMHFMMVVSKESVISKGSMGPNAMRRQLG